MSCKLACRHDKQAWKPQQHATVVPSRIGARDPRGVVGDEVAAHFIVEWREKWPQARALEPFDDGLGTRHHVIIDRVPDVEMRAKWAEQIVIRRRCRQIIA